ncbi:MAG: helix-turn-helix domain-containing protein [Tabrizicola sp.]|jgi:transcriptional regulator GlxA family with amidase domain|nr:helix-turn-helix domain-containing protein [Tabrizicola sp.]
MDQDGYVEWLDTLWERAKPGTRQRSGLSIGILLWPSFPLMSLAGVVEALRHAGDFGDQSRQIEGGWTVLGAPGSRFRASCGVEVAATSDYVHPQEFDHLFVIGGLLRDLPTAPLAHRRYIHVAHSLGVPIAGLCTGSFVLAEEHLMARNVACIHPYHKRDYELAFPGHRLTVNKDFIENNGITTIPGGISVLAFMTGLVRSHYGPDRSAKIVHQLSLPERRGTSDFERGGMIAEVPIRDPRIQKAITLMETPGEATASIGRLARQLGLSERHFSRLFHDQTGVSPRAYQLDRRLRLAAWMLQHSLKPITTIALECGFGSAAHFSAACRKHLGKTPSAFRQPVENAGP